MMKKITFDEEELFVIAVFEPDTRLKTAVRMKETLDELKEDPEMRALVVSAMEKLKRITDQDFEKLALDDLRAELEEEDETLEGS